MYYSEPASYPLCISAAGDLFTFQQDYAPAHWAHETVEVCLEIRLILSRYWCGCQAVQTSAR